MWVTKTISRKKQRAYARPSRSKGDHVSRRRMREKYGFYDKFWLAKVEYGVLHTLEDILKQPP